MGSVLGVLFSFFVNHHFPSLGIEGLLLGSSFDKESSIGKVGYGDYKRVSKGHEVNVLSQESFQVALLPKP